MPVPRRHALGLAAAVIAAGGIGAYLLSAPVDTPDSGIDQCRVLRDHARMAGSPADRYRQARDAYAGSRYADLRAAGVSWMDVSTSAAAPADRVVAAYAGLVAACGSHGVELPPPPGI